LKGSGGGRYCIERNFPENLASNDSPPDEAELLYPLDPGPALLIDSRLMGGVGGSDDPWDGGGGGRSLVGGRGGFVGGGGGGCDGRLFVGGGGGAPRVVG